MDSATASTESYGGSALPQTTQCARTCLATSMALVKLIVDDDDKHLGQLKHSASNHKEALAAATALLAKVKKSCAQLKSDLKGLPSSAGCRVDRRSEEGILLEMVLKALPLLEVEVRALKASDKFDGYFPRRPESSEPVKLLRKLIARHQRLVNGDTLSSTLLSADDAIASVIEQDVAPKATAKSDAAESVEEVSAVSADASLAEASVAGEESVADDASVAASPEASVEEASVAEESVDDASVAVSPEASVEEASVAEESVEEASVAVSPEASVEEASVAEESAKDASVAVSPEASVEEASVAEESVDEASVAVSPEASVEEASVAEESVEESVDEASVAVSPEESVDEASVADEESVVLEASVDEASAAEEESASVVDLVAAKSPAVAAVAVKKTVAVPKRENYADMSVSELIAARKLLKTHAQKDLFIDAVILLLANGKTVASVDTSVVVDAEESVEPDESAISEEPSVDAEESVVQSAAEISDVQEDATEEAVADDDADAMSIEDVSPFTRLIEQVRCSLVKWKDQPIEDATWEPKEKLPTRAALRKMDASKGQFFDAQDKSFKKFCERLDGDVVEESVVSVAPADNAVVVAKKKVCETLSVDGQDVLSEDEEEEDAGSMASLSDAVLEEIASASADLAESVDPAEWS